MFIGVNLRPIKPVGSYLLIQEKEDPDRVLYLAVPLDIYETFFKLEFTQTAIEDYHLNIFVYDVDQEVIVEWIN